MNVEGYALINWLQQKLSAFLSTSRDVRAIAVLLGIPLWAIANAIPPWTIATSVPKDMANAEPTPVDQQVAEVASHLIGVMDTTAQAKANAKFPSVRMVACRVQVQDLSDELENAIVLYQEQALTKNLAKPYRQRFLAILPTPDLSGIESRNFRPPAPEQWVGFCQKPAVLRVVRRMDLGRSDCSIFLQRSPTIHSASQRDRPSSTYIGHTPETGCPANIRGAVRITNQVRLHPDGMDTLDRGFDATGKQVWGADTTPYQYRWQKQ